MLIMICFWWWRFLEHFKINIYCSSWMHDNYVFFSVVVVVDRGEEKKWWHLYILSILFYLLLQPKLLKMLKHFLQLLQLYSISHCVSFFFVRAFAAHWRMLRHYIGCCFRSRCCRCWYISSMKCYSEISHQYQSNKK